MIIKLLERVSAQDVPGIALEIIVVDDGSTDDTVSLLEARLAQNRGKGEQWSLGFRWLLGSSCSFRMPTSNMIPRITRDC